MLNSSRQWLMKLLKNGSMTASGVTRPARAEISNIQNAGFIKWEKSGAGARYIVVDEEAICNILGITGYHGDLSELTPKAKAVALHGDAHKGRDDAMLLLLSTAGQPKWSQGENTLDVSDHVAKFGIASMVVRPGDQWHTSQPVGLVENIDPVIYAKQYFDKIDFQGSIEKAYSLSGRS